MTTQERLQARYFADWIDSLRFISWPTPAIVPLLLIMPSSLWSISSWATWFAVLVLGLMQLLVAWHLRFDGLLFRSLAESSDDGSGLDAFLWQQWRKPITHKTLAQRIAGSQKLIQRYLIITLLFWCSLCLGRLCPLMPI